MRNMYSKYKSTKADFIDEIPAHWNSSRVKYLAKIDTSGIWGVDDGKNDLVLVKIPTTAQITSDGKWLIDSMKELYVTNEEREYYTCEEGDIVVVKASGSSDNIITGKAGYIGKEVRGLFAFGNFLLRVRARECNSKFLYYFLTSNITKQRIEKMVASTTYPNLKVNEYVNAIVPIPTATEQAVIVEYLYHQNAIIDQLILQKEKLIELLKEKRQAVINEAVTKGLNPHAKMKDSGIEWLGEVPEHWEITRIKHIKSKEPNSFVDGPFGSNLKSEHYIEGGEVYVVESGFITTGIFEQKREFKTISHEHYLTINRSACKGGDIIIAKIGANYGMSGILPELDKPAVVSGNSLKLTVDTTKHVTEFIHFFLLNLKQKGSLELIVNATAQPALSLGTLNDVAIAVPPIEEQKQISVFIQNASGKNEELTHTLELQIEKLKEYRQSIISEAVTGKIDVRDWQPSKKQVA